jgi:hypothetical protein
MTQGVDTAYLVSLVTKQVDDHALVVWYNPEGRSLRTSSSDQVPRVTGSEASHDSRASRPTRSRAAVHRPLRQHLEDKFQAPS